MFFPLIQQHAVEGSRNKTFDTSTCQLGYINAFCIRTNLSMCVYLHDLTALQRKTYLRIPRNF
jgi:hypothetical protein